MTRREARKVLDTNAGKIEHTVAAYISWEISEKQFDRRMIAYHEQIAAAGQQDNYLRYVRWSSSPTLDRVARLSLTHAVGVK